PDLRALFRNRHGVELIQSWKMEPPLKDADDLIRMPVECDFLADDIWIGGKMALPQFIVQNNDLIAAGVIFFFEESAAELGVHPKHREKAGRNARSRQPLRFSRTCKVEGHA